MEGREASFKGFRIWVQGSGSWLTLLPQNSAKKKALADLKPGSTLNPKPGPAPGSTLNPKPQTPNRAPAGWSLAESETGHLCFCVFFRLLMMLHWVLGFGVWGLGFGVLDPKTTPGKVLVGFYGANPGLFCQAMLALGLLYVYLFVGSVIEPYV